MRRHREASQDGQVVVFVVIIASALLLLAGLVIDGGYLLAAKPRAEAEADAAARAGVQALEVDTYRRGGPFTLDPDDARQAAQDYLTHTGHSGMVEVLDDRTVQVRVTFDQPLAILSLGGLRQVTVSGLGRARAVTGVDDQEEDDDA